MSVPWYLEIAMQLLEAAFRLMRAETKEERRDALMTAAEAAKAGLDKEKFGP
ncbi:MAG TPA: hypothetical protein VEA38_24820 [Terriglobales bacterium]|nr:hypothetical protein [Terriglobales bacterium]